MRKQYKSLNKIISVILAVLLTGGVLPFYAYAQENTLPSTVRYTIADGEVTITKCTCQTSSVDIVIPETIEGYPVTAIAYDAFGSCFYHEHFTVPATVKSIGAQAFATLKLTSVTVDENNPYFSSDEYGLYNKDKTEYLQYFYGREETEFTVPDGVKKIGMRAFEAANLVAVTLPEGLEEIGTSAFFNCVDLKSINLPESLKVIGNASFSSCRSLEAIEIGPNVTTINNNSFNGTSSLANITVSSDNTAYYTGVNGELYDKAKASLLYYPQGNTVDTSLVIPEGIVKIYSGAITSDTLKHLHLPSTLDADENLLLPFYTCTALEKFTVADNNPDYTVDEYGVLFDKDMITLIACPVALPQTSYSTPSSVVSIGYQAFERCKLTDITLNEGVTSIGSYAFQLCRSLTSITLPKTLISISSSAFQSSPYISDVYYTGSEEEWNEISIQSGNTYLTKAEIHFNHGATSGTCGENAAWSFNEITKTLTISGSGTVDEMESIDEYGWCSFKDSIAYVEIIDGITNVPANALNSCEKLSEIYLGTSVSSVGENAFAGCTSLLVFTAHSGSITIADGAFNGCNENLTFICPETNTYISGYAQSNNLPCITVSFDEENSILKFSGELTVYNGPKYAFLSKFLNERTDASYIYFEKIVFDGVEPDIIFSDFESADSSAQNLTLTNLYVNLAVVKGDTQENITFEEMLELLENGNYDAFKYVIDSDTIDGEKTFMQKVEDFFADLGENALRAISSVINFIAKLFRRK